jgi:hypothetical protein
MVSRRHAAASVILPAMIAVATLDPIGAAVLLVSYESLQ